MIEIIRPREERRHVVAGFPFQTVRTANGFNDLCWKECWLVHGLITKTGEVHYGRVVQTKTTEEISKLLTLKMVKGIYGIGKNSIEEIRMTIIVMGFKPQWTQYNRRVPICPHCGEAL